MLYANSRTTMIALLWCVTASEMALDLWLFDIVALSWAYA